ncbi:class I SAM-dependent methyltransferase, partial [Streptomyces sp. SID3343]|uniref:class I SAM-dependent methyltransferase n=1 Tax=Streptomyces sp. SID3343 TaxID=2690260 RepID=UPI00136D13BF
MSLTIANTAQAALWDGEVGAHWAEHADRYDAIMHAFDGALFAAAGIGASDHVLDIGCGTGHTTRLAARRAAQGHAVGIDLSGAMLERARERSAAHGLANVSFVQGDAQVYPFPFADFDVAISRGGVMFFADHAAAFATIRRALLPAGRLAFVCPQPPRPGGDTARAFAPLNALKLEHA